MTCDSQSILESIKRQLAGSSPCEDELLSFIPVFWDLTASEGCFSNYLHALLTKRETVLALMGCEAYSVDSMDRHRQMDSLTVADSRSSLRSQAQSTANSTRFSTGHGETRYDETNMARSVGTMDRYAKATETGDGTTFYRDDGSGNGFNNSSASNSIEALDQRLEKNDVVGASTETGFRTDCNYEYSTNRTDGKGAGLNLGLIVFGVGTSGSFTGTGSEWRKFTKTRANDADSSIHETNYFMVRDVRDERIGHGSHSWLSQFQADVEWHNLDYDVKISHDRSDTRRHAEAHAQGNGDGLSEDKVEAHNAAQGTAKTEFDSISTRTMNRVDNLSAITLANSQRFRNLNLIYSQLTEQITMAKKRYKQRAMPFITTLPCHCNSCCRCGQGLIARQYLECGANVRQSMSIF